jgi:hypothetical protein
MQFNSVGSLREQLSRVRNYGRFWERYLGDFAGREDFQALGAPAQDETVENALRAAASHRLHRPDVKMIGLQCREIQEEGLVHGACFLNGRFCTFLFSRADRVGLMALASLIDGRVVYSRFSIGPRASAAAA